MSAVISQLAGRLRDSEIATAELFSEVIRHACWRFSSLRRTEDFGRLEQLVRSGAWTDAALTLLALELPQWRIRLLVHDAGGWRCVLSCQRELPDWLDQPIEFYHADLPLAILGALVEVKRDSKAAAVDGAANFSRVDPTLDRPLCCDNFV